MPDLPPGPARDLVALLRMLRAGGNLTVGQISVKSGLARSHVSEVLSGWKAPSPGAAEAIAVALGADGRTALKARALAEALGEFNRHNRARERGAGPVGERPRMSGPIASSTATRYPLRRPAGSGDTSSRRSIGIITGDIRRVHTVDVWVNSENTDMRMSRFDDYTISAIVRYDGSVRDAAGRVVEDIIADELGRKTSGLCPLAPGTAVLTGAGQLSRTHNVRAVVHVAAVYGEPGAGYRQIRDVGRCVTNALAEIDRAGTSTDPVTVLFPLLGTGQGRGGVEQTAEVLVDTAAAYLIGIAQTRVSVVWFLAHTYEEFAAFQDVLERNPLVGVAAGELSL